MTEGGVAIKRESCWAFFISNLPLG